MAERKNSDEGITAVAKASNEMKIDIEEEHNTEAYQETMNIDIENIDKIENSHKYYTKNEGQSTKLYNKSSLMKLTYLQIIFKTLKE